MAKRKTVKRKRAKKKEEHRPLQGALIVVPVDPHARTKQMIYDFLEEGMWKKDAAEMAGISHDTMRRWELKDAYFASRIKASILAFKRKVIKVVNMNSLKDGRIGIEILRTRWPQEWNPPKNVKVEGAITVLAGAKDMADMVQKILDEPDDPEESEKDEQEENKTSESDS